MDGWEVVCKYTKGGAAFGHRVWHRATGFVLDFFPLDFQPQAMIYVNTPLEGDTGVAHALEHALVGKGRRGEWLRAFNELSLATTAAFTEKKRTMFSFQTLGDAGCFFGVLREHLTALVSPDFCDDEVRQDVYHMAVTPSGDVEERGTVYLEQLATYGRAQSTAFREVHRLIYGAEHPLAFDQGGTPHGVRACEPDDVHAFHKKHYTLSNMGAMVVLPDMPLEEACRAVASVLQAVAPESFERDHAVPRRRSDVSLASWSARGSGSPVTWENSCSSGSNQNSPGTSPTGRPAAAAPPLFDTARHDVGGAPSVSLATPPPPRAPTAAGGAAPDAPPPPTLLPGTAAARSGELNIRIPTPDCASMLTPDLQASDPATPMEHSFGDFTGLGEPQSSRSFLDGDSTRRSSATGGRGRLLGTSRRRHSFTSTSHDCAMEASISFESADTWRHAIMQDLRAMQADSDRVLKLVEDTTAAVYQDLQHFDRIDGEATPRFFGGSSCLRSLPVSPADRRRRSMQFDAESGARTPRSNPVSPLGFEDEAIPMYILQQMHDAEYDAWQVEKEEADAAAVKSRSKERERYNMLSKLNEAQHLATRAAQMQRQGMRAVMMRLAAQPQATPTTCPHCKASLVPEEVEGGDKDGHTPAVDASSAASTSPGVGACVPPPKYAHADCAGAGAGTPPRVVVTELSPTEEQPSTSKASLGSLELRTTVPQLDAYLMKLDDDEEEEEDDDDDSLATPSPLVGPSGTGGPSTSISPRTNTQPQLKSSTARSGSPVTPTDGRIQGTYRNRALSNTSEPPRLSGERHATMASSFDSRWEAAATAELQRELERRSRSRSPSPESPLKAAARQQGHGRKQVSPTHALLPAATAASQPDVTPPGGVDAAAAALPAAPDAAPTPVASAGDATPASSRPHTTPDAAAHDASADNTERSPATALLALEAVLDPKEGGTPAGGRHGAGVVVADAAADVAAPALAGGAVERELFHDPSGEWSMRDVREEGVGIAGITSPDATAAARGAAAEGTALPHASAGDESASPARAAAPTAAAAVAAAPTPGNAAESSARAAGDDDLSQLVAPPATLRGGVDAREGASGQAETDAAAPAKAGPVEPSPTAAVAAAPLTKTLGEPNADTAEGSAAVPRDALTTAAPVIARDAVGACGGVVDAGEAGAAAATKAAVVDGAGIAAPSPVGAGVRHQLDPPSPAGLTSHNVDGAAILAQGAATSRQEPVTAPWDAAPAAAGIAGMVDAPIAVVRARDASSAPDGSRGAEGGPRAGVPVDDAATDRVATAAPLEAASDPVTGGVPPAAPQPPPARAAREEPRPHAAAIPETAGRAGKIHGASVPAALPTVSVQTPADPAAGTLFPAEAPDAPAPTTLLGAASSGVGDGTAPARGAEDNASAAAAAHAPATRGVKLSEIVGASAEEGGSTAASGAGQGQGPTPDPVIAPVPAMPATVVQGEPPAATAPANDDGVRNVTAAQLCAPVPSPLGDIPVRGTPALAAQGTSDVTRPVESLVADSERRPPAAASVCAPPRVAEGDGVPAAPSTAIQSRGVVDAASPPRPSVGGGANSTRPAAPADVRRAAQHAGTVASATADVKASPPADVGGGAAAAVGTAASVEAAGTATAGGAPRGAAAHTHGQRTPAPAGGGGTPTAVTMRTEPGGPTVTASGTHGAALAVPAPAAGMVAAMSGEPQQREATARTPGGSNTSAPAPGGAPTPADGAHEVVAMSSKPEAPPRVAADAAAPSSYVNNPPPGPGSRAARAAQAIAPLEPTAELLQSQSQSQSQSYGASGYRTDMARRVSHAADPYGPGAPSPQPNAQEDTPVPALERSGSEQPFTPVTPGDALGDSPLHPRGDVGRAAAVATTVRARQRIPLSQRQSTAAIEERMRGGDAKGVLDEILRVVTALSEQHTAVPAHILQRLDALERMVCGGAAGERNAGTTGSPTTTGPVPQLRLEWFDRLLAYIESLEAAPTGGETAETERDVCFQQTAGLLSSLGGLVGIDTVESVSFSSSPRTHSPDPAGGAGGHDWATGAAAAWDPAGSARGRAGGGGVPERLRRIPSVSLANLPEVAQPPMVDQRMPPPTPAECGTIRHVSFPHSNASEPGLVVVAWPGVLPPDAHRSPCALLEHTLLELLVDMVGNGRNSATWALQLAKEPHVTGVSAEVKREKGATVMLAMEGVPSTALADDTYVKNLIRKVRKEFRRVARWEDGEDRLVSWNRRAANRVLNKVKAVAGFLNRPPNFGDRGVYGDWIRCLDSAVELGSSGCAIELTHNVVAREVLELLNSKQNFWRDYLVKWGLASYPPVAVVASASPGLHHKHTQRAAERRAAFVQALAAKGSSPHAHRMAMDYHHTAIRQHNARHARTPKFTTTPPLTHDPVLKYHMDGRVLACPVPSLGGVSYHGVALSLRCIPRRLALHIPVLASLHSFGVARGIDGGAMGYDEFCSALQRSVLYLDSYFSKNSETGRVELIVRSGGLDANEVDASLRWVRALLVHGPLWTTANLPRIREVVVKRHAAAAADTKRRPEYWAWRTGSSFHRQENLHFVLAECGMAQEYCLLRLRYRLAEVPAGDEDTTLTLLRVAAAAGTIEELRALLAASQTPCAADLLRLLSQMPQGGDALGGGGDPHAVPPGFARQCALLAADLRTPPDTVLSEWAEAWARVVASAADARAHVVSGPESLNVVKAQLGRMLGELAASGAAPSDQSTTPPAAMEPYIRQHWAARTGYDWRSMPAHVALVSQDVTHGVLMHSMPFKNVLGPDHLSSRTLLPVLAAKAWCGSGPHTPFSAAWRDGLAYSSGVGYNTDSCRLYYYADHCPNVGETFLFAKGFLERAAGVPGLREYALCQCFTSRARETYTQRCENLAANLADGVTPEKVRRFRCALLARREKFTDEDVRCANGVVAPLFNTARPPADSLRLVIGPPQQCRYYAAALSDTPVAYIYPCDFWLDDEVNPTGL